MNWLILTFLAVASRSLYGVMTKVFSNQKSVSIYTQAILIPIIATFLTLIFSPLLGGVNFSGNSNFLVISLLVVSQGLGNIVYYEAIKSLTSSTAQIVFSSILIFNTIFSLIFLNAQFSTKNFLGIGVLLISLILVVSGKIEFNLKGTLLMLASSALFSIFQLSTSVITTQLTSATYLLITYLGTSICIFAFKPKEIVSDLKTIANFEALKVPAITTIFSFGTILFAYYAYRIAPEPAKVALLLPSQVVLTVIIGYVFLKENTLLLKKLAAAILVVVAAYLIKS